ncbi:MAG: hypothetical protein AAF432_05145 [Planctomycetota bacterium]
MNQRKTHRKQRVHRFAAILVGAVAGISVLMLNACSAPTSVDDPLATLRATDRSPRQHRLAIDQLTMQPAPEGADKVLHAVIWRPGYTVEVREMTPNRLAESDLKELHRTIRNNYPRMGMPLWSERLAEIIAERNWTELTPALVSRWGYIPSAHGDELGRAEYKALAAMYGSDEVIDLVFTMFVESTRVAQQGLRMRCWNLLHRLDQRDRLIMLVQNAAPTENDLLLQDLQQIAMELGLVPYNSEEILWGRKLLTPEYAEVWSQIRTGMTMVPADRRSSMEFRDLPIVAAASIHEPELLAMSFNALYADVEARLKQEEHFARTDMVDSLVTTRQGQIREVREKITWGDLVAMRMALRAMHVPEIIDHFYDYAERDRADESTEYGGVMRLDAQNRFELIEFVPRIRDHDAKFVAPQAMFDAAYNALFHFHYHAQRYRNNEYAGPGHGDMNYANNTRANCLVLTFVGRNRLNVDFYRHSNVWVDLGTIERPGT